MVKKMETLKQILYENDYPSYIINLVIRNVKEWLQQKLDKMPKGEFGEKSMLLELLEELKK